MVEVPADEGEVVGVDGDVGGGYVVRIAHRMGETVDTEEQGRASGEGEFAVEELEDRPGCFGVLGAEAGKPGEGDVGGEGDGGVGGGGLAGESDGFEDGVCAEDGGEEGGGVGALGVLGWGCVGYGAVFCVADYKVLGYGEQGVN